MWSALQATILFAQDPDLAAGEHMPQDESATFGPKPEMKGGEEVPAEDEKCEKQTEED